MGVAKRSTEAKLLFHASTGDKFEINPSFIRSRKLKPLGKLRARYKYIQEATVLQACENGYLVRGKLYDFGDPVTYFLHDDFIDPAHREFTYFVSNSSSLNSPRHLTSKGLTPMIPRPAAVSVRFEASQDASEPLDESVKTPSELEPRKFAQISVSEHMREPSKLEPASVAETASGLIVNHLSNSPPLLSRSESATLKIESVNHELLKEDPAPSTELLSNLSGPIFVKSLVNTQPFPLSVKSSDSINAVKQLIEVMSKILVKTKTP